MAKANYTPAQLRACEIADVVRNVLAVHPKREGWICRPHHTNRQLKVGHQLYGSDPYITDEVDTLCVAIAELGLLSNSGYTLHPCSV